MSVKGFAIKNKEGKILPSWIHLDKSVLEASLYMFRGAKVVKVEIREPDSGCRHAKQPKMTKEQVKIMLGEFKQRHHCPDCGKKIFSVYWLSWALKNNTKP